MGRSAAAAITKGPWRREARAGHQGLYALLSDSSGSGSNLLNSGAMMVG